MFIVVDALHIDGVNRPFFNTGGGHLLAKRVIIGLTLLMDGNGVGHLLRAALRCYVQRRTDWFGGKDKVVRAHEFIVAIGYVMVIRQHAYLLGILHKLREVSPALNVGMGVVDIGRG